MIIAPATLAASPVLGKTRPPRACVTKKHARLVAENRLRALPLRPWPTDIFDVCSLSSADQLPPPHRPDVPVRLNLPGLTSVTISLATVAPLNL